LHERLDARAVDVLAETRPAHRIADAHREVEIQINLRREVQRREMA
jgi:hypothetical protein